MYAEERQLAIVSLAREAGRVAVSELAPRFGVTSETIRRDLDALAARGVLSRVHGGAVPTENLRLVEPSVPLRDTTAQQEKEAIARRAVELLPARDGLTVLIDGGTTTVRVCPLLPESVTLVVTNSIPAAVALAPRPGIEVRLLGGNVRAVTQATVGAAAYEEVRRLRVDAAFLGANGFSTHHGFSTPDPNEARIKEVMTSAAREVFVVADSSKWGVDHLVRYADLDAVDALVTDEGLNASARSALRDAGLRVELA